MRKLFDWLNIGQALALTGQCAGQRTSCATATPALRCGFFSEVISLPPPVLTEEQALGVVQPPLAVSLYSASLTCVPQAVP
jgi:hypothetical protein